MVAHRNNSRTNSKGYYGETAASRYANFINDVLYNIRKGEVDYVFFVYQIEDLLKYEKERLWTEYFPDDSYFMVGLKQGCD